MTDQDAPLPDYDTEADCWGSWWNAHFAIRDLSAAGITGMDVPVDPWTAQDAAYWTGTARYQPWRDVAAFFRDPPRAKPTQEGLPSL